MRERMASVTHGRFMRRGLTWKSASLTLAIIVAVVLALGALARRVQPQYPVTATVTETRVVGSEPACAWEVDIEFHNDSDRRLRLISVEIADIDNSKWSLLGVFEPAESIVRTYRYPLVGCSAPSADQLTARYGPAATSKERSITFPIN